MKQKVQKSAFISMKLFSVLVLTAFMTFAAPSLHRSYLRHAVGSKVVMIVSANPETSNRYGGGTGFHITTPKGKTYIVTNRHVCRGAKDDYMWAAVRGSTRYHKVKIIQRSDFTDLCLVEPIKGIEGLTVGEEPEIGQHVAALGHPNLQPRTFTEGEVVGKEQYAIAIGAIGRDGFTGKDCKYKDTRIIEVKASNQDRKHRDSFDDLQVLRDPDGNLIFPNGIDQSPGSPTQFEFIPTRLCVMQTLALVTTVMIYHGSSGSPVVGFDGKVVGVVYAVSGDGIWCRAISVTSLKEFLADK